MKKTLLFLIVLFLTNGIRTYSQCAIEAGDNKTIICGGSVQLDAQPKWVITSSSVSALLNSVYYTTTDTGYAVGNGGAILKTSNAGSSWIWLSSITTNNLNSVYFTDKNTGYAVGENGYITKTSNAGTTWTALISGTSNILNSVKFTNDSTAYAVGQNGIILKTINYGTTWTAQTTTVYLSSVYFIDTDTGYAVGANGRIIKTTDAGTNWTILTSGVIYSLRSVYFTDSITGYAVGVNGLILKTTNAGTTWTQQTSGTTNYFTSVHFINTDTAYAVGYGGLLLKTIDAGTTWAALTSGTSKTLRSVYFTDANNGYAAGDSVTVIIKLSQPVSYAWTPSTGLDTINIANPLASPISTTTYYITDTTSTGCIAIDSVTVFVNPLTADAGTDKTIICGGTAQLNVTTNYTGSDTLTYIWSPSTGLNYDTIPNPTATVTDSITYTVTVTTPTGCIAIDTINIIVNPLTAYTGTNMTIVCGGTAQLNVTSNYTGTDTLTYIWSPATGLNYDTIPNPTATITTDSLTYTVTVTTPTGCVAIDSITVYVNPLIANAGSNKVIICGGSIQLDSVITNYTGTDTLTYVWSPSTGLNYDTIPNPTATITTDSLTFTVTVTTPTGCIAIDSITVYVNPLIVYAGTDKTIICGGSAQLDSVITNYTGSSALTYNWSPSTGLNYDTIPNPTAAVSDSTTYTVTVTTSNGCIATDHVTITLTPLPAEDICYVEFDSATSKNNISWASNLLANMDSVHIYNEISTGVWLQVGAASASQSNYIDTLSNPFNQSYSYKISVKDTCGNETSTSASHTTITLLATYDQGTNTYGFTWSEYKGLTIANYNIYGITPGGPDTLIGTVPGNQYFYNYTNPSLFFTKYYVGFTTPSCTSKTNHLVKSNYVQSPTGIAENAEINNLVSLYPNPVTDNLQIKTDLQIINIEITDITGRLLYTTTTSKTIDCSMFVKGVYFVTIKTEKGIVVKKVIKA